MDTGKSIKGYEKQMISQEVPPITLRITMSAPDVDPTICLDLSNNPEAYQCGGKFPYKTNSGPCARCVFIRDASTDDEREKREVSFQSYILIAVDLLTFLIILKAYPYCHGCASPLRLLRTLFCGGCTMKTDGNPAPLTPPPADPLPPPPASSNSATITSSQSLAGSQPAIDLVKLAQDQSKARSQAAQARMFKDPKTRMPTVPVTTESLNAVRNAAGDASRIRVVVFPAVSKNNNKIVEVSSLGVYDNTVRDELMFQGMLIFEYSDGQS